MKSKKDNWKVFRGLTAVSCALGVVFANVTSLAVANEGSISRFFGIGVNNSGELTAENVKYKTAFTQDGVPTLEGLNALMDEEVDYVARVSEEGSVLLKNDNAALPLSEKSNVTIFGTGLQNPVYRGISNGSNFDLKRGVTPKKAFGTYFNYNEEIANAYASGDDVTLSAEQTKTFADYSDAAIVILQRVDGEGSDVDASTKELALNDNEKKMLEYAKNGGFKKIIVLLNSGYPMEVNWMDDYNVDACLWIGYPGLSGFMGVANILAGKANPSGKLVDTYATDSLSSPAMQNFGNFDFAGNDGKYLIYAEGIYVGYKYYETRYEDLILGRFSADSANGIFASAGEQWNYADEVSYPFGYGLSYTTFTQELGSVSYDAEKDTFTVPVTVTNTGNVAGKDVVQVYAQTPYTEYDQQNLVEKSAVQLAGYGKTEMLDPGASETVNVEIDRYLLASYDTNGAKGYILDAGDYYLAIGSDAHDALNNILAAKGAVGMYDPDGNEAAGDASMTYKWTIDTLDTESYRYSKATGAEVTNKFTDSSIYSSDYNYFVPDTVTYLTRQDWTTFPKSYTALTTTDRMKQIFNGDFLSEIKPETVPAKEDVKTEQQDGESISFLDMHGVPFTGTYTDANGVEKDADETWDKFLSQLSVEEMASVTADDFGIKPVEKVALPEAVNQDGPDGIRGTYQLDQKANSTLYNNVGLLMATFNKELIRLRGTYTGEDGLYTGVTQYWGPGFNCHRTPYGGRAFEYCSEDSIVAYYAISEIVEAMQEKGVVCAPKHFAANDQETNRSGVMTFMTEQTLREVSLKAFESAYTVADAKGTMTSYNTIGACYTARNAALMNDVARGEWGFDGTFITDAGSCTDTPALDIISGTDMFCLGGTMGSALVQDLDSQSDGYALAALKDSNKRFYYVYANSLLVNGLSDTTAVSHAMPWWLAALYAIDALVALVGAASAVAFIYKAYLRKGEQK